MKISKEAILSTLPVVLAEDEAMMALAEPMAEAMAERLPEIELVRLYTRIDELPEELLDILAYDFKADWWEYDATLEEKRAVFKKIWYVHRHKGTKASVEAAVGALFPGAAVSEWFEYEDGEPYHFRMNVPIKEQQVRGTAQDYKDRVLFLVNYFKNLRSVLEQIYFTYETEMEKTLYVLSHLGRGLQITHIPEWMPEFPRAALYVSAVSPRWNATTVTNDVTPFGLVAHEVPETLALWIYPYLPMLGYHPLSASEDPDGPTLHIECEGLSASEDGETLVLIGG